MISREKIEYLEQLYHSKRGSGNTSIKEYNTIEEIIKQLEILEILKEHISFKIDERQENKYLVKMKSEDTGNHTYIRLYEEECNKLLKEWLDA